MGKIYSPYLKRCMDRQFALWMDITNLITIDNYRDFIKNRDFVKGLISPILIIELKKLKDISLKSFFNSKEFKYVLIFQSNYVCCNRLHDIDKGCFMLMMATKHDNVINYGHEELIFD